MMPTSKKFINTVLASVFLSSLLIQPVALAHDDALDNHYRTQPRNLLPAPRWQQAPPSQIQPRNYNVLSSQQNYRDARPTRRDARPTRRHTASSYAGMAVGITTVTPEKPISEVHANQLGDVSKTDKSDTGWKIYGGYQYTPDIAIEAGYADTGVGTLTYGEGTNGVDVKAETKAGYLAGIGTFTVNKNMDLMAGLGIASTQAKILANESRVVNGEMKPHFNATESKRKVQPYFTVGARYHVTPTISMRAQYENFGKVTLDSKGEVSVDMLSIGVDSKF